jgi:glycosyltransferase involved in cell wall biosynthesis
MKIGIGYTTHNRREVLLESLANMQKFLPDRAKLVVVDDASDEPYEGAAFRFEDNVGIAAAKNKCLELLDGCDHIFLFDDDTYPISNNWWKPYVESKEPHLMYLFEDFVDNPRLKDAKVLYKDDEIIAMSHPRGCMLYIDRKVLESIGGMDTRYGRWGNEHVDFSNRVYSAGLTSFRYADVIGSNSLIYSGDEHETVVTTVKYHERRVYLASSAQLLEASKYSDHYIEYHDVLNDISAQNNIVLSCYFTGHIDPQKGVKWDGDIFENTNTLATSLENKKVKYAILQDCLTASTDKFVRVNTSINPYFQRWLSYYQYLRDHPEIDNVFCVDATDVVMLKNPFLYIEEGKVYCGDEPTRLASPWMRSHNPEPILSAFITRNRALDLLNAGVVGGSREDVMKICHDIITLYFDNGAVFHNDMGAFNYVLRKFFSDKLEYGRKVTTVFKEYDTGNKTSWWAHK